MLCLELPPAYRTGRPLGGKILQHGASFAAAFVHLAMGLHLLRSFSHRGNWALEKAKKKSIKHNS